MTVYVVVDEKYWNEGDETKVFSSPIAAQKYLEQLRDAGSGGWIVEREVDTT